MPLLRGKKDFTVTIFVSSVWQKKIPIQTMLYNILMLYTASSILEILSLRFRQLVATQATSSLWFYFLQAKLFQVYTFTFLLIADKTQAASIRVEIQQRKPQQPITYTSTPEASSGWHETLAEPERTFHRPKTQTCHYLEKRRLLARICVAAVSHFEDFLMDVNDTL